jgi:hypothetical protein
MPDLRFEIEHASVAPNSATPQLSFRVHISNMSAEPIHSIALRAQVQIEPIRRRYSSAEQERLKELFGEPEQWSKSLQPLIWTHVSQNVTAFTGQISIEIPVPCTFDFNIAMTKYAYGLEGGELPTSLLFSGTVFYVGSNTGLQIAQIPWDRQASYRVPVALWKEMMDRYYPNTAVLAFRRDLFDRLNDFKTQNHIGSWDQVLERMLDAAGVKA